MPRTGTQIRIMVGLIFVSVIVMMGYAIFDTSRAQDGEEEQVNVAGERGAELFAVNCRRCHGLEGRGVLENAEAFPGLPLNIEEHRPEDPTQLENKQARFFSTIECGRVGTLMPAWSLDEGGNLTDQQIADLVTFITVNPSDAWGHMIEYSEEEDREGNRAEVTLAEDLSADATEFELEGEELALEALAPPIRIRIDDELILVTTSAIEAEQEAIQAEEDAAEAEADDEAEGEGVVDEAADPDSEEAEGGAGETTVEGEGGGDASPTPTPAPTQTGTDPTDDQGIEEGGEEGESSAEAGSDEVILLRGYQGSEVSDHEAGSIIYNTPPEAGDDLTGEPPSVPPCGQIFTGAGGGDGGGDGMVAVVDADGNITIIAMDNFFDQTRIEATAGQQIAVLLQDQGSQPHNIAFYDGSDADAPEIAMLEIINGGEEGTLEFTAPAEPGEFFYNCQVHPDQMTGLLVVE